MNRRFDWGPSADGIQSSRRIREHERELVASGGGDDARLERARQLWDGHDRVEHRLDGWNAGELAAGSFRALHARLQRLMRYQKTKKMKRKRPSWLVAPDVGSMTLAQLGIPEWNVFQMIVNKFRSNSALKTLENRHFRAEKCGSTW